MADKNYQDTSELDTSNIAAEVEAFVSIQDLKRKPFERRWYDNNFFDDGYHFRFVSRTTGKIIDQSSGRSALGPNRSIPKASRQIRGVANLLMGLEPFPVVYPQKINPNLYSKEIDPQTGKETFGEDYKKAIEYVKERAQNIGHWITKEWHNQNLEDQLVLMIILAAKHGVSYMQVWPDALEEKIKTKVYDAFDIYCMGDLIDFEDNPMIVKAIPKLISQIKANKEFDEKQCAKINPDNRYASSEIKEAYMRSRYGKSMPNDSSATLILKEAYIKEYVNEGNRDKIIEDLKERANEFKMGDMIIRQVFEAGGIWLRDEYTALKKYPIVPFTFEPGALYQVPLIERFIPANKSLDTAMSRVERYFNTMVAGHWVARKGENFEITNKAGGNVLEYETSKPEQVTIAPLPQFVWNYIQEINAIIEEQGASTSALAQIPNGVKSGVAIESIKSTEYANLKIPSKQLKLTVKKITERMIDIAAHHFIKPDMIEILDKNEEPSYFQIVGEAGVKAHDKIGEPLDQGITVLSADTVVDIQTESGMGFTEQGRRDTMLQISKYILDLANGGFLPKEAVQISTQKLLETFQFGSTQEFMQAIEEGKVDMTEEDLTQIKVAVLEALKEAGEVGDEASQRRIMENKVGTIEALKDSGLADKIQGPIIDNPETAPIPYKDAPPSIQRQMEEGAGFTPAEEPSPSEIDSVSKVISSTKVNEPKKEGGKK